jgi:hypothetical protein
MRIDMQTILTIAGGATLYVGFVLFIARMASPKWHPDGGRGLDETI